MVRDGALMAKTTTGARHRLGEPLASDLAAFCEASDGTLEIRVIRNAVRHYLDARLAAEPELRRRFDEARLRKIGNGNATENVVVMPRKGPE